MMPNGVEILDEIAVDEFGRSKPAVLDNAIGNPRGDMIRSDCPRLLQRLRLCRYR